MGSRGVLQAMLLIGVIVGARKGGEAVVRAPVVPGAQRPHCPAVQGREPPDLQRDSGGLGAADGLRQDGRAAGGTSPIAPVHGGQDCSPQAELGWKGSSKVSNLVPSSPLQRPSLGRRALVLESCSQTSSSRLPMCPVREPATGHLHTQKPRFPPQASLVPPPVCACTCAHMHVSVCMCVVCVHVHTCVYVRV